MSHVSLLHLGNVGMTKVLALLFMFIDPQPISEDNNAVKQLPELIKEETIQAEKANFTENVDSQPEEVKAAEEEAIEAEKAQVAENFDLQVVKVSVEANDTCDEDLGKKE